MYNKTEEPEKTINCITAFLNKDTGKIDFKENCAKEDGFLSFCKGEIGNGCHIVQTAEISIGETLFTLWVDEEGKLKRYADPVLALDILPKEYHDLVLGNIVITGGESEEGETTGLKAEDILLLKEFLKSRAFFCRWNGMNGPFLFLERA